MTSAPVSPAPGPAYGFSPESLPGAGVETEDLVRAHYPGLLQLGFASSGSLDTARQAALHTLAAACHDHNAFSAGGRLWLYNTALREVRHQPTARTDHPARETGTAFTQPAGTPSQHETAIRKLIDRWDAKERLTAVLYYLLHWNTAEIAALLKVSSGAVQAQIDIFRSAFAALPAAEADASEASGTQQIRSPDLPSLYPAETRAAAYLGNRWPAPALSEDDIVELAEKVGALCDEIASPSLFSPTVLFILIISGLVVAVLAGAAAFWVWSGGLNTATVQPTLTSPAALTQPTPFPATPPVVALSRHSTSADILQRWQSSRSFWHSLVIDMQTIDYGPQAYIGPARRYRSQGWALQPEGGIQLFGLLAQPAAHVNLVGGGRIFTRSYVSGASSSRAWSSKVNALLPDDPLHSIVFPAASPWFENEGSFWWAGSTEMFGRSVEIYDWLNHLNQPEARLWLDALTGIILREQVYGGEDFQDLRRESLVTELYFDRHEPPPALIVAAQQSQGPTSDPNSGFLPLQATLTPAMQATPRSPLPGDPPPPGFDPSHSRLIFQFADDPAIANRVADTANTPAMLFADGYFLGETRFGLPWALRCTRSADGSRLAFNTGSDGASAPDDRLHWFNLSEPGQVYQPMPGFHANVFAFSPDGHSLAAAGTYDIQSGDSQNLLNNGLYRIDLGTGEDEMLIEVDDARSLIWSPDGEFLALVGRLPGDDEPVMLVVNADAHMVVYKGEPETVNAPPPAESPVAAWGLPFPVPMGDLDTCATPPP